MLTGASAWAQGLGSVTAAMTDGPFEIGDRVVSLSSSSQGPLLGLRGLVRCPGRLWDNVHALTCLAIKGVFLGDITLTSVCVMAELSVGICMITNALRLAAAGGGHL